MLNLIKYVNRMKKLLFFAVLALAMISCEPQNEGTGYGELYLATQGKLNVTYKIYDIDSVVVEEGATKYALYIKLPVGEYNIHAYARSYYPTFEQFIYDVRFPIRDSETTPLMIPF